MKQYEINEKIANAYDAWDGNLMDDAQFLEEIKKIVAPSLPVSDNVEALFNRHSEMGVMEWVGEEKRYMDFEDFTYAPFPNTADYQMGDRRRKERAMADKRYFTAFYNASLKNGYSIGQGTTITDGGYFNLASFQDFILKENPSFQKVVLTGLVEMTESDYNDFVSPLRQSDKKEERNG